MGSSSTRESDWRTFVRLPPSQRRTVVVATLLLPPVTVLLKTVGYRRVKRWLGLLPVPTRAGTDDTLETARMLSGAVRVAGNRNPLPSTCLSRSLVVWLLLRRWGIKGDIRLGVAKTGRGVAAHAWVEHVGVPLTDTPDVAKRYAPFGPLSER